MKRLAPVLLLCLLPLSGCQRFIDCMTPSVASTIAGTMQSTRDALAGQNPSSALGALVKTAGDAIVCAVQAIANEPDEPTAAAIASPELTERKRVKAVALKWLHDGHYRCKVKP